MLLDLAFVPGVDVRTTFNTLCRDCPEDLLPVSDNWPLSKTTTGSYSAEAPDIFMERKN